MTGAGDASAAMTKARLSGAYSILMHASSGRPIAAIVAMPIMAWVFSKKLRLELETNHKMLMLGDVPAGDSDHWGRGFWLLLPLLKHMDGPVVSVRATKYRSPWAH